MKRQVKTKPIIQASDYCCTTFLSVLLTISLFSSLSVYCRHTENFLCNCCIVKGFKVLFLPSLPMTCFGRLTPASSQIPTYLLLTPLSHGMGKNRRKVKRLMDRWEGLERKSWCCASSVQQESKWCVTSIAVATNAKHSTIQATIKKVNSSPARCSTEVRILCLYQTISWSAFLCLFLIKLKYTKVIILILTFWMSDWKFSKYGISPLKIRVCNALTE